MGNTTITLTGKGLQALQELDIQISVSATVEIDPQTAQRHVTRWVASEVGNLLMGGTPQLVISQRAVWRVPIVLGSSQKGFLGEVGVVDVDATTGELLLSAELVEELLRNAQALAGTPSFPTG